MKWRYFHDKSTIPTMESKLATREAHRPEDSLFIKKSGMKTAAESAKTRVKFHCDFFCFEFAERYVPLPQSGGVDEEEERNEKDDIVDDDDVVVVVSVVVEEEVEEEEVEEVVEEEEEAREKGEFKVVAFINTKSLTS
jgi:hypothetical protein